VTTPDAFVEPPPVIVEPPAPWARVTVFPAIPLPPASRSVTVIVAVSVPLAYTAVGAATTVESEAAALTGPVVIEYVVVPVTSPVAWASRSICPASMFVTCRVATPLEAVAFPRPVTVPAPPVLPNATTVELSLVTVLPFASSIVAVRVCTFPATVEPLCASAICAAGPCT
jgi:hypothetical protein